MVHLPSALAVSSKNMALIISWCRNFKGGFEWSMSTLVLKGEGLMDAGNDHGSAAKEWLLIWRLLALVQLPAVFHSLHSPYHV